MLKRNLKANPTDVIIRVKIKDSRVTTGVGLTGLTYGSASLKISTMKELDSGSTAYTGANIEDITIKGDYVAPSSGCCRFVEVDPSNHPGLYEIHLANARFASTNSLIVTISGAANMMETDIEFTMDGANLVQIDGEDTDGNNATLNLKQLNLQNSSGAPLWVEATGGNNDAAYFKGFGTGSGIDANGGDWVGTPGGGVAGDGVRFVGGANGKEGGGNGFVTQGKGGSEDGGGNGAVFSAGDYGSGSYHRGGEVFGNGLVAVGPNEGHGIVGYGMKDGSGMNLVGTAGTENTGDGLSMSSTGAQDIRAAEIDDIVAMLTAMDGVSLTSLKNLLFKRSVTARHFNGKPKTITAGAGDSLATVTTVLDTDVGYEELVKTETYT
jgi:hypothetical protein